MNYSAVLDRILATVDREAYLATSSHVDARYREALATVERMLQSEAFDADVARTLARGLHAEGKLDRVHLLSALHVIAASPRVRDYSEAARLAGEQEQAALELGGPNLTANLASVDRHRGVLAFLQHHYEIALDHFTRAFERQRSALNLGNILCTLLRLHEVAEARELLAQVRAAFPVELVEELESFIATDPDLALLRTESET